MLACVAMTPACGSGCMVCTGITADKEVCKDDYQEDKDYDNFIREYTAQGGVCED